MKLAQEQAKAYGGETDQLKSSRKDYPRRLELQKKIVEQQAAAYDKAISSQKNEKQIDS